MCLIRSNLPYTMLPRTFLPDHDVIMFASLNRTMMTTNVHPLYLPPIVCWLNRTCVKVQRVKQIVANIVKAISTLLVAATICLHIMRLLTFFAWGVLGSLWSLMVCVTLMSGSILSVLCSERRNCGSDTSVIVDPMAGVDVSHKVVMSIFLLATYIYTWLYYEVCGGTEVVVSWIECANRRGPSLFPILKWTALVFVWINTIGFIRLVRSN